MGIDIRQLTPFILISLFLVTIPLIIFDYQENVGSLLVKGTDVYFYIFYEMVYYGIVLFIFRRDTSLISLLAGAALALVYRMALGAVFGIILFLTYDFAFGSTPISWGMAKYWPAVLLHAIFAPFVMRSVFLGIAEKLTPSMARARPVQRQVRGFDTERQSISMADEQTRPLASMESSVQSRVSSIPDQVRNEAQLSPLIHGDDANQFERAVSYLGETNSVRMALLVDGEGLTLARFNRGDDDFEQWAPMAILLEESNRELLSRFNCDEVPERVDVGTANRRVLLRRIDFVTLIVLADQNMDETIHIRVAQATDMIRKYMSERYSPAIFTRAEGHDVSDS